MSIDPHLSSTAGIEALKKVYRDGLLNDTLPFWIKHSVDRKYGGFTICLDRDGTVIDTDKGIWSQGRFTWLLSTIYSEVEKNPEWMELAKHGIDFIRKYGFDDDGRMFFSVTQSGKPLRKRRYIFSESFTVAAFAAYAKASGDVQAKKDALAVFQLMQRYLLEPRFLPPKLIPETRSMKGLAVPMIMIVTAQILREVLDDPQELNQVIDDYISE
ncbi:MAG: AGE family epimerase/isomerase, partial [SAR324 cluster bacterium]|nr:AGE family epimerase/isomerase [SAR324 cluster bacterium]